MQFNKNLLQIFSLYGATILSLIMGVGVSILTTKLLGPEKFGDFKFYQMVLNLSVVIFTLGIFYSISRLLAYENDHLKIKKLYGVNFLMASIYGVLATICIFCFSYFQGNWFNNDLNFTFRHLGFFIIFLLLNNSLVQILQGSNNIGLLSIIRIVPSGIFLLCLLSLEDLSVKLAITLFYLAIAVAIVIAIITIKPSFKNIKPTLKLVLKENKEFGLKVYTGSLATTATASLGSIMIAYYLNNTLVGFFSLAITICAPLLMIPSIVGSTLFKKFANASKIDTKVLIFTVILSSVSYICFYFLIDPVVNFLYPTGFSDVIYLSRIIAIGSVLHGFGDLFNRFLYAKGKGNLMRNSAFFVGIANILGYYLLIKFFDIEGALITKIFSGLLYFLLMYLGYKKCTNELKL